jgi:hypothetical protein
MKSTVITDNLKNVYLKIILFMAIFINNNSISAFI